MCSNISPLIPVFVMTENLYLNAIIFVFLVENTRIYHRKCPQLLKFISFFDAITISDITVIKNAKWNLFFQ
jgi:hypothetical protein